MHTTNETFYDIFWGTYVVQLGRPSHHVSADKAYSDLLRHVTTLLFATLDSQKPFQDSLAALIVDGLAVTVLHVVAFLYIIVVRFVVLLHVLDNRLSRSGHFLD